MLIFIGIVVVIYLIVAVILPTLKRRRCTVPVTARISDVHLTYIGGVGRIKGRMKYVYQGNPYVADIMLNSSAVTTKQILVNPKKPRQWVQKEKDHYYGSMVLGLVIVILMVLVLVVKI